MQYNAFIKYLIGISAGIAPECMSVLFLAWSLFAVPRRRNYQSACPFENMHAEPRPGWRRRIGKRRWCCRGRSVFLNKQRQCRCTREWHEQNKQHGGAFHMSAEDHRGEVYVQKWINQHQATRRAAGSLRGIVNTHVTAQIRPMKVQKEDSEKSAESKQSCLDGGLMSMSEALVLSPTDNQSSDIILDVWIVSRIHIRI